MKMLRSVFLFGLFAPMFAQGTTLNVMEWEGYVSSFSAKFEAYAKQKGVNVKINVIQPYIASVEDVFKVMRAKEADVVTPSNSYYHMNEGRLINTLQPIDYAQLTNYKKLLPSLREASYDKKDGKKYSVPMLGGAYGLGAKSDAITGWADMWDPQYQNKFAISKECFECNIYNVMMVLGYGPDVFYGEKGTSFDRAKVQAKLNELVANTNVFWGALGDADQLASLELAASYGFSINAVSGTSNWKMVIPKEGQTLWLDTLAIGKHVNGKKLEAAYLLIDYLISEEIQKEMLSVFGTVIVNADTAKLLDEATIKKHFVGDESYFKADYLWRPLSSRTRGVYKTMWRKASSRVQ